MFSLPLVLFVSCSNAEPRYEQILGTVCFVNLYNNGKKEFYDEIFNRLNEIDDEFNLNKENSDISRINKNAAHEDVIVGNDVFSVLECAQKISELTSGAFDVTIEPLVSLWNINTDSPHVATKEELSERLPLVNFRNLILNHDEKSVRFKKENMEIDLGGIAKGFATDEIVKICKKHKIRRTVIDLGGNVFVYGKKPKSESWNVGVKNPEFPDSIPLLKLNLPQISVVTSGIYERFFNDGGKRYHHIFSPKDGYPVENELYSVTVVSENSMIADALTTSFFVLGKEESLKRIPLIEKTLGVKISAIFIEKNHHISFSENFPYSYTVLYDSWKS